MKNKSFILSESLFFIKNIQTYWSGISSSFESMVKTNVLFKSGLLWHYYHHKQQSLAWPRLPFEALNVDFQWLLHLKPIHTQSRSWKSLLQSWRACILNELPLLLLLYETTTPNVIDLYTANFFSTTWLYCRVAVNVTLTSRCWKTF